MTPKEQIESGAQPKLAAATKCEILERMRPIRGWLSDDEAKLLMDAVERALVELPDTRAVVEIGSYAGRSTTVLAGVVAALHPAARVFAIDPHEGVVSEPGGRLSRSSSTLTAFRRNISSAELERTVETLQQRSWQVRWYEPIAFLLLDALHDYASVSRDFEHFEPWLASGAYAAFHDYSDTFPGVRRFVDERLATDGYELFALVDTMVVLRVTSARTAG